jgi:hypothetical protein
LVDRAATGKVRSTKKAPVIRSLASPGRINRPTAQTIQDLSPECRVDKLSELVFSRAGYKLLVGGLLHDRWCSGGGGHTVASLVAEIWLWIPAADKQIAARVERCWKQLRLMAKLLIVTSQALCLLWE